MDAISKNFVDPLKILQGLLRVHGPLVGKHLSKKCGKWIFRQKYYENIATILKATLPTFPKNAAYSLINLKTSPFIDGLFLNYVMKEEREGVYLWVLPGYKGWGKEREERGSIQIGVT